MATVYTQGGLTVVALKKVGSSQLRKTFFAGEKQWPIWGRPKTVTFVRHPAARLWSAYNYFIPRLRDDEETAGDLYAYGPAVAWPEWLDWVLDQELDGLDHHLRPQHIELRDNFVPIGPQNSVFMGCLERSESADLTRYVQRGVVFEPPNRPRPRHWRTSLTPEQLSRIRKVFSKDMAVWWDVYNTQPGYQVVTVRALLEYLSLINP